MFLLRWHSNSEHDGSEDDSVRRDFRRPGARMSRRSKQRFLRDAWRTYSRLGWNRCDYGALCRHRRRSRRLQSSIQSYLKFERKLRQTAAELKQGSISFSCWVFCLTTVWLSSRKFVRYFFALSVKCFAPHGQQSQIQCSCGWPNDSMVKFGRSKLKWALWIFFHASVVWTLLRCPQQ